MREPTIKEIDNACLNYRCDFDLILKEEQDKIRIEAKEWLKAWLKVVEDNGGKQR